MSVGGGVKGSQDKGAEDGRRVSEKRREKVTDRGPASGKRKRRQHNKKTAKTSTKEQGLMRKGETGTGRKRREIGINRPSRGAGGTTGNLKKMRFFLREKPRKGRTINKAKVKTLRPFRSKTLWAPGELRAGLT